MYSYPHYKEEDRQLILSFMQRNPFVTVIGADKNGRVEATQIPVLVEEREDKLYISGHIARKMDHQLALEQNPQALILFTGAHTYVSGTYYTGNLQQASTWNYISVHARGEMKWMNEEGLIQLLKKLTLHFENYNTASTTIYDNLPEEYLGKLRKAIVGFEMEVTELDNVYKLSQNRDQVSYDNIVTELKKQDGQAGEIGSLMEERRSKVFPS
ncbi:MAG: FMN-binding negative transcriptional regulator [Chitinophagaceae bacterium]|nr:FMN-binding negative transcriptional regulator [Chitinophagaceae bacterium]